MKRLQGKVALITGAARGQGLSHAIAMAEEGADIIAIDVDPENRMAAAIPAVLEDAVREVERRGRRIVAGLANVADLGEVEAVVARGVEQLGRLDFVIANAAVASMPVAIFDDTPDAWRRVLEVNTMGAWITCKASSSHLQAGAAIVLIGSTASLRPAPFYAAYNASKHGLKGLMKAMTLELAPRGIRVNAIHPGIVDTPMFHNKTMYKMIAGDENAPKDVIADRLRPNNPMGIPWVEPRDISAAVIFLCSDDARYITGVDIAVDGGFAAK